MDAPADSADNATTSIATQYLHVPDPLALELCVSVEHHEWVGPMLEEFAASLVSAWVPTCHGDCSPASPLQGDSPTLWRPRRAQTTTTSPQAWTRPPLPGRRKGDNLASWMPRRARRP
jgi:hypothetical protein